MKQLSVTDQQLDLLIVGIRLRREQLRKQADELPKGVAKGIVWSKVDECTQLLGELGAA